MAIKSDTDKDPICLCACIGPLYGEPYCGCEMARRGLPLNEEARAVDYERVKAQMDKLFEPGGAFARR